MIARGAPLAETTRQLCVEAERLLPDTVSSVLTVDAAGHHGRITEAEMREILETAVRPAV